MTLLKRATIKSYDAGSHRAAVGIAGSLSVWLDNLAVSDSIPASALVAGSECSVLFHTDDNPDDAVVISVHGAGPITPISDFLGLSDTPGSYSGQALKQVRVNAGETALEFASGGAGGTPTALWDADADTGIQAEESADEDWLRFDTAGQQRMAIDASGRVGIGVNPVAGIGTYVQQTTTPSTGGAGNTAIAFKLSPSLAPTGDGQNLYGIFATATGSAGSYNIAKAAGFSFFAVFIGGGAPGKTMTEEVGAEVLLGKLGGGWLTITDMTGFKADIGFMTPTNTTITRWNSFFANYAGNSVIATHAGLRITDITAGTNKYLIWAGPNVPGGAGLTNLRLDAGNPANAGLAAEGDSQLNLTFNENGVLAMRNVRWRTFATLGAADKVMIAQ